MIVNDRLLTLEEAAHSMNLMPRTLYQMVQNGDIMALKAGSLLRLDPDEVMNYTRKRQNQIGVIQRG
ncbi:helix-turn-helix domain-containing protein [Brevibacillus laterosporus]|uniref:Helix-turn-helix domain-containing protein n=1 Tax=Brevibacillus laterosporus TaxID=1465 RepID=A0A0F7EF21_BRELA|nr:hypothetical protein EX87_06025 [Brevibacillus laterosporus]